MTTRFAIIENGIVSNIAAASPEFAQEQGWIACSDEVGIGWLYENENFIAPPPFDYAEQNKEQAESLLQATDWTATVDINDPQYSNPYLDNQSEFLAYRNQVRQIAVTPPTTPAVFPPKPDEVWVTV